jgi:hypothetical protein
MILSDRKIIAALKRQFVRITPEPDPSNSDIAPTIHAGFGYRPNDPSFPGNPIQLEIWNTGPLRIRLVKGLRIWQLIFEEVHGTPSKGYDGSFSVQGPDIPVAS